MQIVENFINEKDIKKYVKYLENKNINLKLLLNKKIKELQNYINNKYKDNIFDLILYIISGIFIIYILHTLVLLVKS